MSLSDKRNVEMFHTNEDVDEMVYYLEYNFKEFIKKLKERGLKRTLYPKYLMLMLTIEDLKELAGEELKWV